MCDLFRIHLIYTSIVLTWIKTFSPIVQKSKDNASIVVSSTSLLLINHLFLNKKKRKVVALVVYKYAHADAFRSCALLCSALCMKLSYYRSDWNEGSAGARGEWAGELARNENLKFRCDCVWSEKNQELWQVNSNLNIIISRRFNLTCSLIFLCHGKLIKSKSRSSCSRFVLLR